jgi:hypothetical protein
VPVSFDSVAAETLVRVLMILIAALGTRAPVASETAPVTLACSI